MKGIVMENYETKIMDALSIRRTASALSLRTSLNLSLEEIAGYIGILKMAGRVRTSQPACAGTCSECASCTPASINGDVITENTIIISMENIGAEDDEE